MSFPFNVRVYGLLLWQGKVLVSDEIIRGTQITKFPGGGLEFGEGLKDALLREIQEEMGLDAQIIEHYYTTDFFLESAWRKGDQVISIYYLFSVQNPDRISVAEKPFEGAGFGSHEIFRWLDLATACTDDMTLPIDKHVLEMLLRES